MIYMCIYITQMRNIYLKICLFGMHLNVQLGMCDNIEKYVLNLIINKKRWFELGIGRKLLAKFCKIQDLYD